MAPPSFIAEAVLESKRKALAAKQAGDIPAAMAWMQQAREWEQPTTSDAYQRLAMLYKKNGDIEGAKDALRRSKQLKTQEQQEEEEEEESPQESSKRQQQQPPPPPPPQQQQRQQQVAAATETVTPKYSDPVNQAIDDANLDELLEGGEGGIVSYSVDEMLDVETMADMQASGMEIPTREDYQKQAVACKKKALVAKEQNDMAAYKKSLVQAKDLLAAAEQLFSSAAVGDAVDAEDDGEDYSLLDELMGKGLSGGESADGDQDGFFQELFGSTGTAIELDDLDDLDAGMLKDMIEAGMEVPDVEEILQSSKQKKAMALAFKNEGNMIAAKSALEESKRLERKAKQLADLLRSIERGNVQENLDPDAILDAMMNSTDQDDKPYNANGKKDRAPMLAEPETLKPSHQYKEEAVRYKQENRMDDALAALRMYKSALAAETAAADAIKRAEYQQKLQHEIIVAREQIRFFRFYERFVDQACGCEQLQVWTAYLNRCAAVLEKMKSDSHAPVPAVDQQSDTAVAKLIAPNQDLGFVSSASSDPRIEVAVLEAFEIAENKNFRRYVESLKSSQEFSLSSAAIQLKGVIQLPPSADLPEEDVEFTVDANDCLQGESFQINHSIFVYAERGTSRFAKLLRRRLARRRVTIEVLLVPAKKKNFWPSSAKSDPVLLGTAVVELRHLLERRSVAGDFPLLDVTRRHEIGGKLRLAVCTNQPFEETVSSTPETAATGVSSATVALQPYPLLVLE